MRVLLKVLITAIACLGIAQSARSETRPEWVNSPPTPDTEYRYYVGRATGFEREDEAYKEARRDAIEQAIRENFGLLTQIHRRSEETSLDSATRRSFLEESAPVTLRGFVQFASFHKEVGGLHSVWLLFRYSNDAINHEAKKFENRISESSNDELSESEFTSENEDLKNRGSLEIVTIPSRAEIYIDGDRWGETPIRLRSRLEPGLHEIEIIKDGFGTLKKKVRIVANMTASLVESLPALMGRIEIHSTPPGAIVTARGVKLGKTPILTPDLRVGDAIQVKLTHPNAHTLIHDLEISTDGVSRVDLELQPKDTEVGLRIRPSDASIWMDGAPVPTHRSGSITWVKVPPGDNRITLLRQGYLIATVQFHVEAGQRKLLRTIALRKDGNANGVYSRSRSLAEYGAKNADFRGSNDSPQSRWIWNPSMPKAYWAIYYLYRNTGPTNPTPGDGIGIYYNWGLSSGISLLFGFDYIGGRPYGIKTSWGSSPGYADASFRLAVPFHLIQSDVFDLALTPGLRIEAISSTTQSTSRYTGSTSTDTEMKGAGIIGFAMPLTFWFSPNSKLGITFEPNLSICPGNGNGIFESMIGLTFR